MEGNALESHTIRPVRHDELVDLADLDKRMFGPLAYPEFVIRQFFDLYGDDLLVLENAAAQMVGYSFGVCGSDRTVAWILGLAVDPGLRRRGFGRQLTQASLERMREIGVEHVRLTVEPDNVPAIGLYRALGFEFQSETPVRNYFGHGEDRWVMDLALASAVPDARAEAAADTALAARP